MLAFNYLVACIWPLPACNSLVCLLSCKAVKFAMAISTLHIRNASNVLTILHVLQLVADAYVLGKMIKRLKKNRQKTWERRTGGIWVHGKCFIMTIISNSSLATTTICSMTLTHWSTERSSTHNILKESLWCCQFEQRSLSQAPLFWSHMYVRQLMKNDMVQIVACQIMARIFDSKIATVILSNDNIIEMSDPGVTGILMGEMLHDTH